MEVDCEGCAGCCIDWRPLAPAASDHERRGAEQPLDDRYNLVPLTCDDVRGFVDAGYGDALRPRVWTSTDPDQPTTMIDGRSIVAVDDRPIFMIGMRQPPKPVGPFGILPRWLRTCVFLDPTTLQCRVHESDLYPESCSTYPAQHLQLDVETECERVEEAVGGTRLLDGDVSVESPPLPFGPRAIGWTVFAYPNPDDLLGCIQRLEDDRVERADRAKFVAAAAGHSPGSFEVNEIVMDTAINDVLDASSWIGTAMESWSQLSAVRRVADPRLARRVEEAQGAPGTPGWST